MSDDLKNSSFELALDIAETSIDCILDEGILHDIPLIGIAYKCARIGYSISDRIFMAKIVRFVEALDQISPDEKEEFRKKIEEDPEMQKRVGESLVLILNKFDDLKKPQMLTIAFRAFIRGEINYEQFRRICVAIDICLISDLEKFSIPDYSRDQTLLEHLNGTGLVMNSSKSVSEYGNVVINRLEISEIGHMFQELYKIP